MIRECHKCKFIYATDNERRATIFMCAAKNEEMFNPYREVECEDYEPYKTNCNDREA